VFGTTKPPVIFLAGTAPAAWRQALLSALSQGEIKKRMRGVTLHMRFCFIVCYIPQCQPAGDKSGATETALTSVSNG
jgi:hypothetical protein